MERWFWSLRGWMLFALILAVAFHWWLFYLFNNLDICCCMITQSPTDTPRPERIQIDPALLKEQKAVQNIRMSWLPGTHRLSPK